MKMTEKWKERKNHKEDNTDKKVKEKKSVKQKIKESMNKKYLKNGSYSVVIRPIQKDGIDTLSDDKTRTALSRNLFS